MENNNLNQEVLDKLTKVCLCKAIPRSRIKDSIRKGALTVADVSKATGSCTGGCKGRRCTPKIQELIDAYQNDEWQ
ncbi:BFD-like [2Fe-2S] binding domain-containing protein [Clostridium cavendishii DSM 21758]|uniref:BFD-like [2Fe-2S] binding domain-containing protein n=1 Tax=Clostridium cavendishii DSM 21758 TaxID=1121302 RepID=A0A1M6PGI1_9CLOT|nr:(2Fe-2S)-binding protein [Clostridium cavendishii]SHK07043.1 BFD-like [2Fe-2S] binding domain-containing protein [Clostridium cavendishii DSM 21758]